MYEELITECQHGIASMNQVLEAIYELPELEGIVQSQIFQRDGIILCHPYDLIMFKRNTQRLVDAGWTFHNNMRVRDHCGEIHASFDKERVYLYFHINPEMPGSTCRKQIISYEQVPVYEIVCGEAE